MKNIILPELGEGIDKATVACWHTAVGNQVSEEDDVVELVTDKASFNVPAGVIGTVKQICVGEGQDAKIGEILAVVEPLNID